MKHFNRFLISKSHKTLWSDTLWKIMHQEPPQNGNLARRHNQMFHKKAFSKWQTSNGKTIQYFRTGYSFVQRAIQTWEAHIIQVQNCSCNCSHQVSHLQLETAHNKIYRKCNWKYEHITYPVVQIQPKIKNSAIKLVLCKDKKIPSVYRKSTTLTWWEPTVIHFLLRVK